VTELAVGIVLDPLGDVLVLENALHGQLELPGAKLAAGETPQETVQRAFMQKLGIVLDTSGSTMRQVLPAREPIIFQQNGEFYHTFLFQVATMGETAKLEADCGYKNLTYVNPVRVKERAGTQYSPLVKQIFAGISSENLSIVFR